MLLLMRGTDTESPWVHVGFGYPVVNEDHRRLMEDSAPTMEAPCR